VTRTGWQTVHELTIAALAIPDGSVVHLDDLELILPTTGTCALLGRMLRASEETSSLRLIVQLLMDGKCVVYGYHR
jgi:hypothetical protein